MKEILRDITINKIASSSIIPRKIRKYFSFTLESIDIICRIY